MKKHFSLFILLSFSGFAVLAQDGPRPRFAVSAGYGLLTVPQVIESVSDLLSTALTAGTVRYEDATFSGGLIVGLKFPSRKRVRLGIDGVYESFQKNVYSTTSNQLLGTSDGRYISLIPRLDYYWLDKQAVRLYSGIGAGLAFASQEFNSDRVVRSLFAFNVTPLGVELGGTLSVYGEASFGYNGLLSAGLRLRL